MKRKCLVIFSLILFGSNVAFPQIALNSVASRAIGQPNLVPETGNPNWVDGRELFEPEGIALDTSTTPPIVYVADTINNRIMAWKNATGFSNGQPADLIIGPPDQYTTSPGGPGTTFPSGVSQPVGLAVLNGDLYVADTGNNRVLRFRKPFAQTNGNVFPDLWLGQPSLTSSTANNGGLSGSGLKLSGFQSYLAFDSSGNLWVSDAGNNRVLEFPSSVISCSSCGGMSATVVIGQPNLVSSYPALPNVAASGVIGNQFNVPTALAFDSAGRLYVSDNGNSTYPGRVLVFSPPFQPGGYQASGIMGVFAPTTTTQPTQAQFDATVMGVPSGIFFFTDQSVGIIDSGFNRIMVFPPYTQWPSQSTTFSPQATQVFGQTSFTNFGRNGTLSATAVTPPPGPSLFSDPTAAFFSQGTNELYLADTGNNRAIVLPVLSGDGLGPATRVLGQDRLNQGSINLIEGREFQFIQFGSNNSAALDAGIAIDNSGSTPHLYISDPNNHRILGFKDIRNLQSSAKADIVIGQPDLATALCNYPSGDSAKPSASSLCFPKGILVDSQGNLYVADSFNGRVLRFPAPFSQTFGQVTADLVLGQSSFTSSIKDPTNSTMSNPYGLAITGTNGLLVSDQAYNRVLYFPFTANGTFTAGSDNGKPAAKVFGQLSFSSVTAGSSSSNFNSPHHIACDTNGQLYVADSANNRIIIFGDPNSSQTATAGQPGVLTINGLGSPEGVYVNPTTGEVWVTNTTSRTAVRYPKFETLLFNQTPLDPSPFTTFADTLALAQDQFGDLVLADAANRVSIFYPGVYGLNAASFAADKQLAPGMLASIFPLPATGTTTAAILGTGTASNSLSTWPTTLNGVQLLFNGTPAPLDYVGPGQINFQVPNGAPVTGTSTVQVQNTSTGQIYGAGLVAMDSVSPGIFICGAATGNLRQACVLNQDYSVNSGTNAAARGSVIQIFATGEGFIPNAPPDGTAATGAVSSPASLRVFMSYTFVDEIPLQPGESNGGNFVKYSGLAPGLVGVWQVNVQIPAGVAPGNQIPIALVLNGDIADPDVHSGYQATVAVK